MRNRLWWAVAVAAMLAIPSSMASRAQQSEPAAAQPADEKQEQASDNAKLQSTSQSQSQPMDAVPDTGTGPDPLTPPEPKESLTAPGAPRGVQQDAAAKPAEAEKSDPIAEQIRARLAQVPSKADHKDDVAGLTAFYNETNGQPVWTGKDGFNKRAELVMAEIRKAGEWGLTASAFDLPSLSGSPSPEALANADIKLSLVVLKYARHARGGRVEPSSISAIFDQTPRVYEPKSVLQAISTADAADAYLRGLHPKHEQFLKLKKALASLTSSDAAAVPQIRLPQGPNIKPGSEHAQVELLRKRLGLKPDGKDTLYDDTLAEAVKKYQSEKGLDPNGIIDRKLRASLNDAIVESNSEKRQRILVNMERWRWMPDDLGNFYVWDSIPEQLTRVLNQGKVTLLERIVVGRPSTPTPVFSANMQFIIFHPEWGVPDGIKTNELAPALKRYSGGFFDSGGSRVLARYGLRVSQNGREVDPDSIDWSQVDIRRFQFIQPAGGRNVLGIVKFRFPNKHDVYMHDTPDRHLFNVGTRTFSHGCMRTQNPVHLAEVLLAHDKGWSAERVRAMADSGGTSDIKLTNPIPVHVTYFTVDVTDDGKVRYHPDIYGLDGRVASALAGRTIALAAPAVADAEPRTPREPRRTVERERPWSPFESWN